MAFCLQTMARGETGSMLHGAPARELGTGAQRLQVQGGCWPLLEPRKARNALMSQRLPESCIHQPGDHAMAEKDLKALFVHQLKDTYFAENAILKTLPQMAEAARSEEL